MSSEDLGPFYVLLGNPAGQLLNERPPDTALGAFPDLLPIVVTCASREHAEAVNTLNTKFLQYSPRDAHVLAYCVREGDLRIWSDRSCRIYAIRKTLGSRETGVWIGFPWSAIEDNIATQPPTVEQFMGKLDDAKAGIIFMLKKKGFNFPLHAQDKPLPAPRAFLPRSAPASLSPVPLHPAAPSPTKSRVPHAQGVEKTRVANRRNHARGMSDSASSDDSFASAEDEGDHLHDAVGSLAISERRDSGREREDALVIQILSQFIAPPASMSLDGNNILRFPISFGADVDEFLMKRGASEGELWSILRVRVHASNVDQFVHHLVLWLGSKYSVTDVQYLWAHIKFPCV